MTNTKLIDAVIDDVQRVLAQRLAKRKQWRSLPDLLEVKCKSAPDYYSVLPGNSEACLLLTTLWRRPWFKANAELDQHRLFRTKTMLYSFKGSSLRSFDNSSYIDLSQPDANPTRFVFRTMLSMLLKIQAGIDRLHGTPTADNQ